MISDYRAEVETSLSLSKVFMVVVMLMLLMVLKVVMVMVVMMVVVMMLMVVMVVNLKYCPSPNNRYCLKPGRGFPHHGFDNKRPPRLLCCPQ